MTSSELVLSGSALAVAGAIIGGLIANNHQRRMYWSEVKRQDFVATISPCAAFHTAALLIIEATPRTGSAALVPQDLITDLIKAGGEFVSAVSSAHLSARGKRVQETIDDLGATGTELTVWVDTTTNGRAAATAPPRSPSPHQPSPRRMRCEGPGAFVVAAQANLRIHRG